MEVGGRVIDRQDLSAWRQGEEDFITGGNRTAKGATQPLTSRTLSRRLNMKQERASGGRLLFLAG